MRSIQLTFKKLGNHWYLDIPHDNPNDLKMDRRIEYLLNRMDRWNDGKIDTIYLTEQCGFIIEEGLIQFTDKDLLRYFTTNDEFMMDLYISNHKFKISSKLYALMEQEYQLDLHVSAYRVSVM